MCGIAGILSRDRHRCPDPDTLVAMAAIQSHRGPDGFGCKVLPECGVGFSHARLAIIDLHDSGRQPLVSDDGRLMLAHNGEFYDFQRLRADLTSRGARFATKVDSEVILHLYRIKGLQEALKQARGEFAFALYDRDRDRLMLARDRFGIKPLYWTSTADGIVFGSEIKAVFACPGVERAFDDQGLFHQLMQTMVPGTTPYKDVWQVRPGHVVTIERRGREFAIEDRPYWDMPFPLRGERSPKSEQECIDAVREQLLEAVQLRLVADVPVACYLSGGIDSCSILGLAAACRQNPVKAFTIGFEHDDYDESGIATEMARSVGAEQDVLRLSSDDLYENFERTHWHAERTIYNTLAVAKFLMSRHVHSVGYKVVVTGEGSDELFAGYPSFRQDLYQHGLEHLPEEERAEWSRLLGESNRIFTGAMLAFERYDDPSLTNLCGFTPACLQPWLNASRRVPALLHPEVRERLKGYSPGEAIAQHLDADRIRGRHPLDIAQYVWIKTMLEGQILTWGGDRVDMAHSMEARPAFLDHHLAETAAELPPTVRIKGRVEKYVLREAMKGLLPSVLYEREKFAFMAPPAHKSSKPVGALRTLFSEYLPDRGDHGPLLDAGGVRDLFRLHDDPQTPAATLVQLDALINHLLGVRILQRNLVEADIPGRARQEAVRLGWKPDAAMLARIEESQAMVY